MKSPDGSKGEIIFLIVLSVFLPPLGIPLLVMTLRRRKQLTGSPSAVRLSRAGYIR